MVTVLVLTRETKLSSGLDFQDQHQTDTNSLNIIGIDISSENNNTYWFYEMYYVKYTDLLYYQEVW